MPQLSLFDPAVPQHDTLDQLIDEMMNMGDDPLANAGTRVVISRGNPKAKLLLVGEAPGPQENIQGVPFVGRAGQLLDKILLAANFDPQQDVYITNSVFRMPPGEGGKAFRPPTTQEIEYYKPYLLKIIQLVDPVIILLTGNVACQSMLGTTGITRLRGEWSQIQGRWVMPIFHPSYLLRNPSRSPGSPKSLMWEDIQTVRRKFDGLLASGST